MLDIPVRVQMTWSEPITYRYGTIVSIHAVVEQHPNGNYQWTAGYAAVQYLDGQLDLVYLSYCTRC